MHVAPVLYLCRLTMGLFAGFPQPTEPLCRLRLSGHNRGMRARLPSVRRWLRGFGRVADPRISLASLAAVALAAAVAAKHGHWAPQWLVAVIAGIFALEWAKNASGEIFDFRSGVDAAVAPKDRSPFSGGKRVLVDGMLTVGETRSISLVGYALCALVGGVIAVFREPLALPLGLIGAALAYYYHAPPLQLAYRGFGELAVFVAYGPLLTVGTYRVLATSWSAEVLWISLVYGLLVAAFLWINEFPDFEADRSAGKRTCVVRLGKRRAAVVFAFLCAGAWLGFLVALLWALPRLVALGLAGAFFSLRASLQLLRAGEATPAIIPAQKDTLVAFVVFALGVSLGCLGSR
ncbi:MAG: hypothetical protein KatS3mg077_2520 [Candidatus Binatia bacterium]|nr:MAG: hypothetical protein KatS3mg077_2520 [Candidatus Binatia bacterium]